MRVLSAVETACVAGSGIACGPDGSWIPDSPFGYNFTTACQSHDIRYSDGSGWTRQAADAQFLSDLHDICTSQYDDAFLCNVAAELYGAAVSIFGGNYYQGTESGYTSTGGAPFHGATMAGASVWYVPSDAAGCIGDYFDIPTEVDDWGTYG